MRILIAENDSDFKEFLKHKLEEKCFAVDTSLDGETALLLAKTTDYDVIVLEYSLSKKNAFEVCAELRTYGKETPIIIISVMREVAHKILGFNHGIDDYITKPFYTEELCARIQALLRRPRRYDQPTLTFEDLTLDTNKQKVLRGTKSVYLTRKEYSLLEYLLKNPRNVVSRGEIMEHIWDINLDPFSNTIETHILNLRKKIDAHGKKKLIHCVPGRGYKIDTCK